MNQPLFQPNADIALLVVDFPDGMAKRVKRVAEIASAHADNVDREGRFPHEAVAAMRQEKLLGIQVPSALGGESAGFALIAEICCRLGQACASSAMIFAMHHIKCSSLVAHAEDNAWQRHFMQDIAARQLLLASATTEGGIGGNLRNSICAIEISGDMCYLQKETTVISYATEADAILITSRASKDSAPSDQVMTVFVKGQYSLEKTTDWDTLGMRGTCSEGFIFTGSAPKEQILPKAFAEIAAQSMLAASHILWSGLWYGIAVGALTRAQNFVRAEARKNPGHMPPAAIRLADAVNRLHMLRATVLSAIHTYETAAHSADQLSSLSFAVAMNNVKLAASEAVLDIVNKALMITGIAGYKNNTPFSLGRHLRDAHSARLMISNDRILGNTANMLLIHKLETGLLDPQSLDALF